MFLTQACSSGLDDDAKQMTVSSKLETAFRAYDLVEHDGLITADELLQVEKKYEPRSVATRDEARSLIESFDMNGDGVLDSVEFSGLLHENILLGVPSSSLSPHRIRP